MHYDVLVYRVSLKSDKANLIKSFRKLTWAEEYLQQFRGSISSFYVCDQSVGHNDVLDFNKTTGKLEVKPAFVYADDFEI